LFRLFFQPVAAGIAGGSGKITAIAQAIQYAGIERIAQNVVKVTAGGGAGIDRYAQCRIARIAGFAQIDHAVTARDYNFYRSGQILVNLRLAIAWPQKSQAGDEQQNSNNFNLSWAWGHNFFI